MRKDLKRAVALVRAGLSYGEAAKKVGGITRNAVAGACTRARLRTGRGGDGSVTATVVALYLEGASFEEIKDQVGWESPGCGGVHSALKRAGVKANRRKQGPRP